jgi:mevalonate kinase
METYSRSYLQTLQKNQRLYKIENQILQKVLQEASGGHTKYIVNGNWFYEHHQKEQITKLLVSRLKERLPEVSVEYREATDLRGNIERGIVIDWS